MAIAENNTLALQESHANAMQTTGYASRVAPRREQRRIQHNAYIGHRKNVAYHFAKRAMDVALSLAACIVLAPFMLLVALIIYIDDPNGSPLFVQYRIGKDGKRFRFYKFRSMVVNAEERLAELREKNEMDGPVFKIKDDPRVTRIGRFIRKTSIDELPQLINILRGEMSLVGPRPPLPCEVEQYRNYERQRLTVKPGLTCYWQVRGRNGIGFQDWVELDLQYIMERTIWIDIKLIFKTIRVVFMGTGH